MAKFTIAPSGLADLDEIWNYISENNQEAAEKFLRTLVTKFQLLADNKEIGTRQDDFLVEMRSSPSKVIISIILRPTRAWKSTAFFTADATSKACLKNISADCRSNYPTI